MITIVITYRNRDTKIVEKSLDSLHKQTNKQFEVVLVDYGSVEYYRLALKKIIQHYPFVKLISCPTEQQLWCKSRAINIALKKCKTSYFLVGDIDMIYHNEFVNVLHSLLASNTATYFQVGFLSKEQSKQDKLFQDYQIAFKSNSEATGITLFNTDELLAINGFDEFYNGWGSEDTDTHLRLKNNGITVNFYEKEVLLLHQWHSKEFRSNKSLAPYHSTLEQLNAEYLKTVIATKRIKSNLQFDFGRLNTSSYERLEIIDEEYSLTNRIEEVNAFINGVLLFKKDKVISFKINKHVEYKSLKQTLKNFLGKKTFNFLDMSMLNNLVLETIVLNFRNNPYKYTFNKAEQYLQVIILV